MRFHLNSILSVTTGRLVAPLGDLYQILNFVNKTSIYTHEIPAALATAKPHLLATIPALANVTGYSADLDFDWRGWLSEQVAKLGALHEVEPLPNAEVIDTADKVFHRPSGESWTVACVDIEKDRLMWCGWPEGYATLSNCQLLCKATKGEREALLISMSKGEGIRASYAKKRIEQDGIAVPKCDS